MRPTPTLTTCGHYYLVTRLSSQKTVLVAAGSVASPGKGSGPEQVLRK